MEPIPFCKMSGSGNDFIVVDNRDNVVDEKNLPDFITRICRRKMSVGADGLILIEPSDRADFKWRFYNSDGSPAALCGNGARCAARFAHVNGIAGVELSFETEAGLISARIDGDRVKVKMPDPTDLKVDYTITLQKGPLKVSSVNTGVPHVVVMTDRLENVPVLGMGREIRYHPTFAPAGTNVNFVCPQDTGGITLRTYERGVEDETLACGTGSIAGALIAARILKMRSPINVLTRSGQYLTIYFKQTRGRFHTIYMQGDARIIYTGRLRQEAWQ